MTLAERLRCYRRRLGEPLVATLCALAGTACNPQSDSIKPSGPPGSEQPSLGSGGVPGGRDSSSPQGGGAQGTSPDAAGPHLLFDRGTQGPNGLHASERFLYWYESNLGDGPRVLFAPRDGSSPPQVLAPTESFGAIGFLASDAQYLYWVESERILRVAHGGGEPEVFPLGRTFVYPYLAIEGTNLYVTDLGCFRVARVSTSSFEVVMLRDAEGSHVGGFSVVAADADNVYCSSGGLRTVLAIPQGGGESREIAHVTERYAVGGIALAGNDLYYLQTPQSLGEPDQSVWRVARGGGEATMLTKPPEVYGGGSVLLYDGPHRALHWASGGGITASLFRYGLEDGTFSILVSKHHLSGDLTLDSSLLYYAELDPSGIFTLSL